MSIKSESLFYGKNKEHRNIIMSLSSAEGGIAVRRRLSLIGPGSEDQISELQYSNYYYIFRYPDV